MPRFTKAMVEIVQDEAEQKGFHKGFAAGTKDANNAANVEVLKAKAECLAAMAKGLYAMAITMNGTANWKP